MASVNDLAAKWRRNYEVQENRWFAMGVIYSAMSLEGVAHEAWYPVSEPPTEADGDKNGYVAAWHPDVGFALLAWHEAELLPAPKETQWARLSDVCLMPEGSTE